MESYSNLAEHPKISIELDEYNRILENMKIYAGKYDPVQYCTVTGETKIRKFVPFNILKFSANWMATLIFNEKCRINIADEGAGGYITALFERNNFTQNFQQYLEVMFAVGGLGIRPYYSAASRDIKLSWCLPDRFFPLESNTGEISEAAISTKTREVSGKEIFYYTLLEFHEWVEGTYTIRYELYESDSTDNLGSRVSLKTLPKYSMLPESTKLPNVTRSQFVYLKPATMNNIEPDSPLGVGFCDNAQHTINTLNVLHDKFRRSIDRSRFAILIQPENAEVVMENGNMYTVNDPDDIFLAVPGAGQGMDAAPFKEITIELKPDPFIKAINFELRTFEAQNGISPGTFTFDGSSTPKTAREVVSEDSMTYLTRNKQIMVIGAGIRDLVWSILELAKEMKLYHGPTKPAVTVDFDDGVFQDKESQLDYYSKAVSQKLIPRVKAIQRTFTLTEEDAEKWIIKIQEEENNKLREASRLQADLAFGASGSGD